MDSSPRVAVVSGSDATDPRSWSGTPAGIVEGLRAAGAEPVVIDTRMPDALRLPLGAVGRVVHPNPTVAHRARAWVTMRSRVVDRRLRAAAPDGAVVLATDSFDLRPGPVPWVTYDDMTVAQARAIPASDLRLYPERATAGWATRHARLCRAATACCAVSPWAAGSIVEDHGVPAERVHVVGIGAPERSRADGSGGPTRRDWSTPRFLFVGVDWDRKNGDAVLRAFARLRADRPDATLDLVGGHPAVAQDGVVGHGLLPLGDPEAQSRLDGLFARATCFVLPSALEPAGIVHVEAGKAGIPSIGTAVGGASALIGDGGLVVDPGDDDALLAAMRRLADPGEAARRGALAAEHASGFTWKATAEGILRALGLG
jgi:hypothetical protein